jgi:hypothetical protein
LASSIEEAPAWTTKNTKSTNGQSGIGVASQPQPSWPDLFGPPMITVLGLVFMGPPHSAALQRGMTISLLGPFVLFVVPL